MSSKSKSVLGGSFTSEVSRKDFLHSTVLLIASAAILSVPGCGTVYKYRGKLNILSEHEALIFESILFTMFPSIRESEINDMREFPYAEGLESYLSILDNYMLDQFRISLKVIEYGPYIFSFKFTKFTSLTAKEKEQFLRSFMNSNSALKKSVFEFVKINSMVALYQNPYSKQFLGLNGLSRC